MPVILQTEDYQRWLSPEPDPYDLMRPFPSELMTMWPIGKKVGSPKNDTPDIIEEIDPDPEPRLIWDQPSAWRPLSPMQGIERLNRREDARMRFHQIPDWSPGYINVCPQHVAIVVKCLAYGEQRTFDKQKLPGNKRHALIEDIEPHLKCSSCGAKAGKLLFGSFEPE